MDAYSAEREGSEAPAPETPACAQDGGGTRVYLTIDTEYESGFTAQHGPDTREANFRRSIMGEARNGAVGIGYQLGRLDEYGLKAVFFVDPMPALLWGVGAISDIVEPIVRRGHDVQLHLHSEWLALAGIANPLGEKTGSNLKDFTLDEQLTLIDFARQKLVAAGAPNPVAFRAGNYGANDDTLRALARLGIAYDTSHSPGFAGSACEIGLGSDAIAPTRHCGVIEVPVGCIGDIGGNRRHAQLTALSRRELVAALRHARDSNAGSFTIVSHSFELLNRRTGHVNGIVKRRFDRFCAALARLEGVTTATYAESPPRIADTGDAARILPANPARSGLRIAEQAAANVLSDPRNSAALGATIVAAATTAAIAID
jgi:hypothetical protein